MNKANKLKPREQRSKKMCKKLFNLSNSKKTIEILIIKVVTKAVILKKRRMMDMAMDKE